VDILTCSNFQQRVVDIVQSRDMLLLRVDRTTNEWLSYLQRVVSKKAIHWSKIPNRCSLSK